jgi:hypothetical protein
LADLIFDGVRSRGFLGEAVKVREQFLIDTVAEIIAGLRLVMVNLPVFAFGRGLVGLVLL